MLVSLLVAISIATGIAVWVYRYLLARAAERGDIFRVRRIRSSGAGIASVFIIAVWTFAPFTAKPSDLILPQALFFWLLGMAINPDLLVKSEDIVAEYRKKRETKR